MDRISATSLSKSHSTHNSKNGEKSQFRSISLALAQVFFGATTLAATTLEAAC